MGKRKERREFARARLDSGHHRRIMITMMLLGVLAFVPVLARLVQLMVVEHDFYSALALRNQTRVTSVAAHRGTVFDRNMETLAVSVSV